MLRQVERVVHNALAKNAVSGGYLRLLRIIGHRLYEKPIHHGEQKSVNHFTKGELSDAPTARP
jgi:hypothetical protein